VQPFSIHFITAYASIFIKLSELNNKLRGI